MLSNDIVLIPRLSPAQNFRVPGPPHHGMQGIPVGLYPLIQYRLTSLNSMYFPCLISTSLPSLNYSKFLYRAFKTGHDNLQKVLSTISMRSPFPLASQHILNSYMISYCSYQYFQFRISPRQSHQTGQDRPPTTILRISRICGINSSYTPYLTIYLSTQHPAASQQDGLSRKPLHLLQCWVPQNLSLGSDVAMPTLYFCKIFL